jgi:hypothetical protein
MPKKKPVEPVRLCAKCYHRIDNASLEAALKNKTEYRHECGRVLVKGARPVEDVR